MNLMEVQSRLNKLPPVPESVQYLTAAAQGGNPQVPPYMALARISEINREIQTAQNKPQPPAEPLNQSLPKQALQSMGIGALPQGGPQGMPQGGPQGMPQQGGPQQAPQAPQPVMAAGGGLMNVPVDPRMFEYGSGGIVAFGIGGSTGSEDSDESDEGDATGSQDSDKTETNATGSGTAAEETAVEDGEGYDAEAELKKLMPQIQKLMQQSVRPIRTRAEVERGLAKDYGVDEGPIGKNYLTGLASLQEAKNAERAKKQANIDESKKFITSRALLDYSDATRGQTGMGGIGALARSRMNAAEKYMGEETGLREDAIKQNELMNEAQYKFQGLRQAQKDGDIKAEQKNDLELSKIAERMGTSKSNLMARLVTGNLNLMGKYETAQASRDVAVTRAKAKKAAGGTKAPSNEAAGVAINAARLKEEHPDWTPAQINAEALRQYKTTATAPAVEVRENTEMQKAWAKAQYNPDYRDLSPEGKKEYERAWKQEYLRKNPQAPAPASAPAASTTPPLPPGFVKK